jgi:aerobic carbon-monoxide dehydrogenase large subunit
VADGFGIFHADDARFLRGKGRYTSDIAVPGALEAVFLRSPYPHARITGLDVTTASAMPGVALVLTGQDMLDAGLGGVRPIVRRQSADGTPMFVPPRLPLAVDVVRFAGDPVVLVMAETRALAEDAAEAVAVDWEELDAVTDTRSAAAEDAPQVWPEAPGNIAFEWQAGDTTATTAALERSAHVTTLTVPVTRTTASPLEPRAVLAEYDLRTEIYRLTTGLQSPWQARDLLARDVLHVSPDRIEVVCPDVGGSFGMKGQTFPEFGALLHASRMTGRPVRWTSTRSEALLSDDQGRDVVMTGSLGLDADGRITAIRMEGITALGAYLSTRGTLTVVDNVPGICGPYHIPTAHAKMRGIFSNTPSISPYRGAGRPEASLFIERLIDEAAFETGRDPIALRRRNFVTVDDMPYSNALGFVYDCGDFHGTMDAVTALGDLAGFAGRRAASAAKGLLRGLGLASIIARSANGQFEAARLTLGSDGTLTLDCGSVSHGQGHSNVFPKVAAEVLGIAPDQVRYVTGHSTLFDKAVGTFGSRSAGIAGPAVQQAAQGLIDALRPEAARALNAGVDDLTFAAGAFVTLDSQRITLSDLAARCPDPVSATAQFAPKEATFPNSAHLCEVEIDPETGIVEVSRYAVVEDVGSVLDLAVVKGQIHGGIAQGLAQVMTEQIVFDPQSGQLLTGSLMDFALPRASDIPYFAVQSRPVPTQRNPLGVKGAGEGGTIGALPAFQNAVADALRPFGVRDVPMPATGNAIWQLIRDAGSVGATPRTTRNGEEG